MLRHLDGINKVFILDLDAHQVRMYACMYVYMYVCMYVCMYI